MKLNVAVLFGGRSVEHEISVISALQAYASIDKAKYDCFPVYIDKDGTLWSGEGFFDIDRYKDIPSLKKKGHTVTLYREGEYVYLRTISGKRLYRQKQIRIDIAFPIVHGQNAEDGTVQGYLHMLGLPYVGCDILSSALGMDKYVSKLILRAHDIPVLPCVHITQTEYYAYTSRVISDIETLSYPVIIKPVDLGSSIGIKIAHDVSELKSALDNAFLYSDRIIAERAVTQLKEINCSVWGDADSSEASECEEPVNAGELLSYGDKYLTGGGTKGKKSGQSSGMASLSRLIPADITPGMRENIRDTAKRAFRALGCAGVVRIDFIIDKATGEYFLNEVNTIPGSLAFYLWEPLGTKYTALLSGLIESALTRHRKKSELTTSFETNVLSKGSLSGIKK